MFRSFICGFVVMIICLATPEMGQTVQTQDETIKERVKPSIEAGVEYLRSAQTRLGTWVYNDQNGPNNEQVVGATALCAIAMMECGVDPKDRQIQAAGSVIRKAANDPNFVYTYSVALSVLFFDRLNRDKGIKHPDVGIIGKLTNDLIRGQAANGQWGYKLPGQGVDNSNTQFAVVALWVARKYFNPKNIDVALSRTEKKLRGSQDQGGGWNYDQGNAMIAFKPTGSMTCAGILGIALHAGARQQQNATMRGAGSSGSTDVIKTLNEDKQIALARAFILRSLHEYIAGTTQEGHITYFLWSLERVATLYRWRKLDGVDWFEVGATYLMKKQQRAGFWSMDYLHGPNVDTAFALLFLAKSNLLGSLQEAIMTDGSIGGTTLNKDAKKVPKKDVSAKDHAKELLEKLLTALPDKQNAILEEMTETRGSDYANALVEAIEKLQTNASKEAAREALANRFKRLTANSLGENMRIDDREIRLASATAARLRNNIDVAPHLIPLLNDQDVVVSTAALEALKALSGQDFGKSIDRWSRWLDNNNTTKKK